MSYLKQLGNYIVDRACLALVPMEQRMKAENNLHGRNLTSLNPDEVKAWQVSTIDKVAEETFKAFHIDKIEKATSNPFALIAEFFDSIGRFILKRVVTVKVREKAISQKEALEKKENLLKTIEDTFLTRMEEPIEEGRGAIMPFLRDLLSSDETVEKGDPSLLHNFKKDLDRHRFTKITHKKNGNEAVITFDPTNQVANKNDFIELVKPKDTTSVMESPYHKALQTVLRQVSATPIVTGFTKHLEETITKHINVLEELEPFKGFMFLCADIAVEATIEEKENEHIVTQTMQAPIQLMHNREEVGSYEIDLIFHLDPQSGAIKTVSAKIKHINLDPTLIGDWKE